MATRNLLHKNRLNEFREWCGANGFECRDGRGEYQVLQIKKGTQWHVLYERAYMPEHLTVPIPLLSIVRRFIATTKKQ
jgi:hypothetical protein